MSSRPAHVAKLAVVGGGAAYATLLVQAKPRKGRLKVLNIISKHTNDKQYNKVSKITAIESSIKECIASP